MRLIFNPYFDEGAFIDLASRNGIFFDGKIVGPLGLLSELEERLGLAGTHMSEVERLVLYVKAMRDALDKAPTLFFRNSFENDEIGTARTLLRWRDAAVLAGWDSNDAQPTPKFAGLSAIEARFDAAGTADRWRSLLDNLTGLKEVHLDFDVELACREEAIEPHISKILKALSNLEVNVTYSPTEKAAAAEGSDLRIVQEALLAPANSVAAGEKTKLSGDGSIGIVHFSDFSDAQQWAASVLAEQEGTVLVNGTNNAVADILFSLGHPTVAASVAVDSTAAAVFRLGLSLFRSPVDVNNLLAYLRLPVNPVASVYVQKKTKDGDSYYRALNRELADSLIGTGGLSEWAVIIEAASFDHDGNPVKPKVKEALLGRLYMWEKSSGGVVRKSDILGYLENLGSWCASFPVILEDPSWGLIRDLTEAFRMLMENEPEQIPLSKLLNWADGLSAQSSQSVHPAQVGSIPTVKDIRAILDKPKSLVWLDCVGLEATPYEYDFLSPSERRYLDGGFFPKDTFSELAHKAVTDAIARVAGTLTLVTYDTDHGSLCAENPIVTELRTRFEMPVWEGTIPEEMTQTGSTVGTIQSRAVCKIDPALLEGRMRETESYSSLSELFQNPFDYVLDYVLKYGSYGETTIINLEAVRGTVAHKYIEDLINECNKDVAAMRRIHEKEYDKRIVDTAQSVGVVMLADENRLEFAKFKTVFRKSFLCLLDFIKGNGYSIFGTEYEIMTELPVIGKFYAKVDLLLKNAAGEILVVDFKWSESSYYVRALENGRVLQLALYKAAVEADLGAKVINTGYFILPKYHFYTVQEDGLSDFDHVIVSPLPAERDVFEQACNSYRYRMDQLKTGIIEEGEIYAIDSLQYGIDTAAYNLYPLEIEYGDDSTKARNHWGKNVILKGGLDL